MMSKAGVGHGVTFGLSLARSTEGRILALTVAAT